MQAPDEAVPSPARWRLILALAIFLALASAAATVAAWWPHHSKEKVSYSEKMPRTSSSDDGAFFYRTLGHVPAAPVAPASASGAARPGLGVDPAPGSGASYTLEIAVAQSRAAAETLIDELHDTGIEAYYTPLTKGGRVVYRVRRGIFISQRDADQAAVAMRSEHAVEAKVVKLQ